MQKRIVDMVGLALLALTVFLVGQFINGLKENKYIGAGMSATNTIMISGMGEVQAVPDIATIYVTIRGEGKTQKAAQDASAVKEKKALDVLDSFKIDKKDIKTTSNSVNPKYEYVKQTVECLRYPCPDGTQTVVGYEAYESLEVKVRNSDDAGKITQALSGAGVEYSGPNYAIDDDEKFQDEAREKAIADAKEKAEKLAKELGVHLVRITSFSENGNYPMYYAKAEMATMDSGFAGNPAPQLPKGENTISSNVTITYEIR